MSALSSMAMDGVKSALRASELGKVGEMGEGRNGTRNTTFCKYSFYNLQDLSIHSHTCKAQFAASVAALSSSSYLACIWLLAASSCHVMAMSGGAFTWPRPTCGYWPRCRRARLSPPEHQTAPQPGPSAQPPH